MPRSRGSGQGRERSCSIARTVAILSDGWGFMVLRECYFGVTRFDGFRTSEDFRAGVTAFHAKRKAEFKGS